MNGCVDRASIMKELEYAPLERGELDELASMILGMRKTSSRESQYRGTSGRYYDWMYFQNPAGKALVFRARHHGKLVSSFAIAPKVFSIEGKRVVVGKTMDMFTHPDYQGMGIMKRLLTLSYDAAKGKAINIFYVTPSVNSYPIFLKKMGYREDFHVSYLMGLLRTGPLLKLKWKIPATGALGAIIDGALHLGAKLTRPPLRSAVLEEVVEFGSDLDTLWKSIDHWPVTMIKDSTYMNWRYIKHPDKYIVFRLVGNARTRGFVVLKWTLRQGLKIGEIVDWVCDRNDGDAMSTMIILAIRHIREAGCVAAQTWSIRGSGTERLLRAAGLRYRRKRLLFLLSPNCPTAAFYNGNSWCLSSGDGNDV